MRGMGVESAEGTLFWGQGYPFLFCSPGPFYSGQLQNRAFDRTAEAGEDAEEVAGLRYNL